MAWVPKGFEELTGLSSAKGLTVPAGSQAVLLHCVGQDVNYRDDGTDPDATTSGTPILVNDKFWYDGDLTKIKFFETAASGTLRCNYYG